MPKVTASTKESFDETIAVWEQFFQDNKWQDLIRDHEPIKVDVGDVYRISNTLDRDRESMEIIDMSNIPFSEPHYHHHQTTIYFVLEGSAIVVNGKEQISAKKGDVIILPSEKAHFAIPGETFIIASIALPPYCSQDYFALDSSNPEVMFDYEWFKKLTTQSK